MKTRTAFRLALATVALAGCAVGPDYHPPKTQAPANWSEAQLGGTTNGAMTVVEWWKTFHDPELNSLIQRGAATNYDLRVADGACMRPARFRASAVFDLGPTINGGAGYADTRQSKNSIPFNTSGPVGGQISSNYLFRTDLYDAHFDASWEIDVFGGKRRALQEANALLASAEEDRRDVLVSVLAEVARNYIDVRHFQQRLAIAHQNIAAQQDAVDITRDRFHAGLASELDAKEADVLLATTQSQVPVFEQSLKQAVHRLGVLIGQERARCSMNSVPPRRSPRRHPKCRSVCRRICCVERPRSPGRASTGGGDRQHRGPNRRVIPEILADQRGRFPKFLRRRLV